MVGRIRYGPEQKYNLPERLRATRVKNIIVARKTFSMAKLRDNILECQIDIVVPVVIKI